MAARSRQYTISIPLDASGVEGREGDQEVRVVARDRTGKLHSTTASLGRGGKATAKFNFAKHPGALHIAVGPAEATDEEVLGLQTLTAEVTKRQWGEGLTHKISPIIISPYYWFWWLRWCRIFTVRGRVECPDGSPVPGAEVCAYDVDWWWWWSSKQQVGCAETDIDGTFEIRFRWCCGWWPWWWWRWRVWSLDNVLAERIGKVLQTRPDLTIKDIPSQPSLKVFNRILGDSSTAGARGLKPAEFGNLPGLREKLLTRLPASRSLEALRIWPWYPWAPWWDCRPDIIFKVTQDCETVGQVILDETVGDTRWNVANPLDVNLVVSDDACCVPPPCEQPPCEDEDCIIIDTVCGIPFTDVGGNPSGIPASPVTPAPDGYAYPGPVPVNDREHHRPFAGTVPVRKNPQDLAGIDYYEIEVDDGSGSGWQPLPVGVATDFRRRYWDSGAVPHSQWADFDWQVISGHEVVETRTHYETTHPPVWGNEATPANPQNAWWLSTNYSMLVPLNSTKLPQDGTYRFRVIGWLEVPGSSPPALTNPVPIPVCADQAENYFVLTFDNRELTPAAVHTASHNCAQGVHLCTTEPDTHISAVRVDGVQIDPCDTVDLNAASTLEVDFLAHDSDEHLASYELHASWGLNQSHNLFTRPGASVSAIGATVLGWLAGEPRGNYGTALTQGAGATEPKWAGGNYRLTIPMGSAFPDPCCYQLELWAFKRTILGGGSTCDKGYRVHVNGNKTEYSIGVGVCPPSPGGPIPGGPIVVEPVGPGPIGPGPLDPRRGGG